MLKVGTQCALDLLIPKLGDGPYIRTIYLFTFSSLPVLSLSVPQPHSHFTTCWFWAGHGSRRKRWRILSLAITSNSHSETKTILRKGLVTIELDVTPDMAPGDCCAGSKCWTETALGFDDR